MRWGGHLLALAAAFLAISGSPGCATPADPTVTSSFVDDATISSRILSRLADEKLIDSSGIRVETLAGTVVLSGTAKNTLERNNAESIATATKGAKLVRNEIVVRP